MLASGRASRWGLRTFALGYLGLLLLIPLGMIFFRAFEHGLGTAFDSVTTPEALHAFYLTILVTLIAVLINAIIDLPFAISPVVIGLSLLLVYSETGWFGDWLGANGIQVIFALPGIVLATIFVTLPFVVREVVPVLHEIRDEQEQAARTLGANWWQTFWRITLPAIRWGVSYGVVIGTARALGEFGAVAVVSGRIAGQTQTATIWIAEAFSRYDYTGAYVGAVLLAVIAVSILVAMNVFKRKEAT